MKQIKKLKVVSGLLCMTLMIGGLAGCKDDKKTEAVLPWAINEMAVDTIDELPDWTGTELDLSVWYCYGDHNEAIGKLKKDDKFQAELKRVSGISFSEKTSYDNGGGSADSKVAKMVSSKTWPHVAVGLDQSIIKTMIESDKIYALDEYIEKYMPNYMKYINSTENTRAAYDKKAAEDGKIYTYWRLGKEMYKYTDPEYSDEKYADVINITPSRNSFWIRDDILKRLHPETKALAEQKAIYMQNGEFSDEEITDFTIKSRDEFRKLLEDIAALNITENGRKVWPTYSYDGMDNWSALTEMKGLAGDASYSPNDYFVYFDAQEGKLMNPIKQDWFKEHLKFWADLYRDGLVPQEAFIDTRAAFEEKMTNGEYAVIYGINNPPTDEQLKAAGKNYAYRKVFIDIPIDTTRFRSAKNENIFDSHCLVFFKEALSEKQLEQILRTLDFFYTDAGMKYSAWGPEKSGLYETDENGNMRYTDKEFESAIIFEGDQEVLVDYGYESFPLIEKFITRNFNKYEPKLMYADYDTERVASDYINEFLFNFVEPVPDMPIVDLNWNIWNFTGNVEGVKSMWNARTSVEEAITKILTAKTDAEFEQYYQDAIAVEERLGYDDECFEEMNKFYIERNGKEAVDAVKHWTGK